VGCSRWTLDDENEKLGEREEEEERDRWDERQICDLDRT